jgi:gamma-glutamyltranspeptidase/glutathione hydrolase
MTRRRALSSAAALLTVGCLFLAVVAGDRPEGLGLATRSVVFARHGVVAAAHPLAVQAGLDILKKGGNAVDAAIAVNAALGFLEPMSCGIGGDVFVMVWDAKTKKLYALNGSGRAPAGLTADKVKPEADGTIPTYSPFAWTVPGAVRGWFDLHDRFGKLPMKDLLAPATAMAREGEPVPQVIAGMWERSVRVFKDKPGFADVFLPGGRAPHEGEIFRNPALARAYELLAQDGADAFYAGPIGASLVAFSKKNGGFFEASDLAAHKSEWVEPIGTTYRGVTLWEVPPNDQGLAALEMLNMLEGTDIAAMGRDSADFWHLMIETKKIAFEDRAKYYADPKFAKVPVKGLLAKDYAAARAKLVDMKRAMPRIEAGNPALTDGDTTYFAVADGEGNMVSMIQSNYTGFGSGYVVADWGFGIQDRGALFSLKPDSPNRLMPGKRPFHTIIPAMLTRDGVGWVAFGVMGGDMQPQGHVQIVVDLVDFRMNLQEAGDAPRYYHTGSSEPTGTLMTTGGILYLESGISPDIRRELGRRGHRIQDINSVAYGGYQAVSRDPVTGVLSAASESRKDGCAMGY